MTALEMAAEQQARAGGPRVNAETVRRIERATGTLGTAAIAAMENPAAVVR